MKLGLEPMTPSPYLYQIQITVLYAPARKPLQTDERGAQSGKPSPSNKERSVIDSHPHSLEITSRTRSLSHRLQFYMVALEGYVINEPI
jgi:hypothetical protein